MMKAVRTEEPPVIDGMVTDPQWQTAPPALDFTQFDPDEGALPTEVTSVRLLYDDAALYVGVICYDARPAEIVPQLTRRDRSTESDRFTVQIDSYNDDLTAFVFSTNVSGIQSDGILSQDGTVYDLSWDAVWTVKTRRHMDGWSAEFEIPYHALRFAEQAEEVYEWGINFRRYISRKRETIEWVMIPRSERVSVSKWGHVDGIRNISPPLHLTLSPYVSGRGAYATSFPGRPAASAYDGTGGLDLKYGLTRNFTVDATINPDFGQVEVDQAVLNLTVFETLFPEKRPFFTEGSQLFTFGAGIDNTNLPLFFSRRVGRPPRGSISVAPPAGGTVEENPRTTTILGAAKISGRAASGFSLGVVTAATDEERAVVRDVAGNTSEIRTEPRGLYNVARVKQDLGATSWVGGIMTSVARENVAPAFSGGIDWNLRLDGGAYAIDGYLGGARSSAPVDGRDGAAGRLLLSRISSEHWFYTASYDFYTRHFNINDIGFFAQPHDHGGYMQVLFRENFAQPPFRRYFFSLNPEYRWNWDGIRTHAAVNSSLTGEFTNFWFVTLSHTIAIPAYDDVERGIIGIFRKPAAHDLQMQVLTDERMSVSASLTGGTRFDERRKRSLYTLLSVKVRPSPWMELAPSVYYERTRDQETGVFYAGRIADTTVAGLRRSLFGERDLDELDMALRGIVTFTQSLSLQFYGQVLLARGKYDNFSLLTGSTTLEPTVQSRNYDFNYASFNANILLRWEYLPGSAVYLVWTQERFGDSGDYETEAGQRFREAFRLPHDDVLLLKLSYLLPL
jgi:hypothetical protein